MNDVIFYYLITGIVVNLITMLSEDIRYYWFEFGFFGFIMQLACSSIVFPFVLFLMWADYNDNY